MERSVRWWLGILILASTSAVLATEQMAVLPDTVVQASALGARAGDMGSAVVLQGEELALRRAATLGDTLASQPGIHSSGFGPGVGRPVIRGLEGSRVKVLNDGVDVLDASTSSPDHAITGEMQLLERIEVIKGPATLMYGGGAIGGVVNLVDRRIPTYVPERGVEGDLELRGNTVADERAGALGITAGAGQFALRLEGSRLRADPYDVPARPSSQHGAFNDSDSAALGLSWITDRGYLGVAYSEQDREYGLLAHEHADCHTHGSAWHCGGHGDGHHHHDHDHNDHGPAYIDMQQRRWELRGEYSQPFRGFERVRLRMAHTDYTHREMEGDEPPAEGEGTPQPGILHAPDAGQQEGDRQDGEHGCHLGLAVGGGDRAGDRHGHRYKRAVGATEARTLARYERCPWKYGESVRTLRQSAPWAWYVLAIATGSKSCGKAAAPSVMRPAPAPRPRRRKHRRVARAPSPRDSRSVRHRPPVRDCRCTRDPPPARPSPANQRV